MSLFFSKLRNKSRINIFIVISVLIIMVFSMALAGVLFYTKTAGILSEIYEGEIGRELEKLNRNIQEQIAAIDSLYAQLVPLISIAGALEPAVVEHGNFADDELRLAVERQMGYMLVSNPLWTENLLNGVFIFDNEWNCASFSAYGSPETGIDRARVLIQETGLTGPMLKIRVHESIPGSVFFARDILDMETGSKTAAIVIDLNSSEWARLFSTGADKNWLIMLSNEDILWSVGPEMYDDEQLEGLMLAAEGNYGFQETTVLGEEYFIASNKTDTAGLTAAVAVLKEYLMRDLGEARSSFLQSYSIIAIISTAFTLLVIILVTSPIKHMTDYVRDVSKNRAEAKRPKGLFREFDEFAEAFSEMLDRLELYYDDLHEQEVLLKNAEIKALQAQIDPHFLFNVMNTIAWKAEMSGNSEVYDMVISLSEMLQVNTMSTDKAFITLKEELDYVRLYIYLQQKRFEGKFSVDIDHSGVPESAPVPRFSIQPLVENAILHGFEPLPDDRGDCLLTVRVRPDGSGVRVWVEDNGAGFPDDFDVVAMRPATESAHSHVALKNLNRRLALVGGPENSLSISKEGSKTVVSFRLPGKDK